MDHFFCRLFKVRHTIMQDIIIIIIIIIMRRTIISEFCGFGILRVSEFCGFGISNFVVFEF